MFLTNRLKLTLLLSLILFVAFVGLSIINYRTTKTSLTQEIVSSSLPLLRENIYSEILRDITPAINRASAMAHNSFLINWAAGGEKNTEEILQYLSGIRDEYGYFSTFFISENTKNYYHYSGILKQVSPEDSHDVWYYRFIESGKGYVLDVDTDEASDNLLTIFINFRIEDYSGSLLGVTGVGIKMANFSRFLRDSQEKYSRSIYLVDNTGLIQAHSDTSRIQNENLFEKDIHHTIAGTLLEKDSRPDDLPARWGGDEFVILLSCDLHDARITAERLRHAIKETGSSSEHDSNLKITISAGVSEYRDGDSLDSLLARADKALYSAKNGGRDTVHTDS